MSEKIDPSTDVIAMSESEKLVRAIAALREIADAEMEKFNEAAQQVGFVDAGALAFQALTSRAHVCLMAIDPSYAG